MYWLYEQKVVSSHQAAANYSVNNLHNNESDHEGYFSDHMNVILSTIEPVYQTVLVSQWFALLLSIFSFIYLFMLSIIFNICNRLVHTCEYKFQLRKNVRNSRFMSLILIQCLSNSRG